MADKFEKIAWWVLAVMAIGLLGFAVWTLHALVVWVTSK